MKFQTTQRVMLHIMEQSQVLVPSQKFNVEEFRPIRELECGKCYYIILKTGNGQVEIPDFTYANRSDDDPEQNIDNRITDNCVAQAQNLSSMQ